MKINYWLIAALFIWQACAWAADDRVTSGTTPVGSGTARQTQNISAGSGPGSNAGAPPPISNPLSSMATAGNSAMTGTPVTPVSQTHGAPPPISNPSSSLANSANNFDQNISGIPADTTLPADATGTSRVFRDEKTVNAGNAGR